MLFYITSALLLLGVAYLHARAADEFHQPYQPPIEEVEGTQMASEGFKDTTGAAAPPTRIDIEPEVALSSTGLASASLSHQSAMLKDIRELLRRELREQRNRPVE